MNLREMKKKYSLIDGHFEHNKQQLDISWLIKIVVFT